MSVTGMDSSLGSPRFARVSSDSSNASNATKGLAGSCGLDCESLAHHRAAASDCLQIRHAAATWRGVRTSRRREGSKSGWGSRLQKGTHGLRLTEYGVHDCGSKCLALWVLFVGSLSVDVRVIERFNGGFVGKRKENVRMLRRRAGMAYYANM